MKKKELFLYLIGLLTGFIITIILGVGVINATKNFFSLKLNETKLNTSQVVRRLIEIMPSLEDVLIRKPIYVPKGIVEELFSLNGVIDYAYQYEFGNIVDFRFTKVIDKDFFVIKPNLKIRGYVLKTAKSYNFLPPIFYLPEGSIISQELKDYIEKNSFRYSTDDKGYRITLPLIKSEKHILLAGDSVAFGIALNDDQTIASHIQKLVGEKYKVTNIGVGGYGFDSIMRSIRRELKETNYDRLIYIACENDFPFDTERIGPFVEHILEEIVDISNGFKEGVLIAYVPSMFYVLQDIYLNEMPKDYIYDPDLYIKGITFTKERLISESRKRGAHFVDFTNIANDYLKKSGSIWSRFALYNDYSHLSSEGARLLAQEIYEDFGY